MISIAAMLLSAIEAKEKSMLELDLNIYIPKNS